MIHDILGQSYALPQLVPIHRLTYDEEGDILYMSFGEPREATDSIDLDGIVYRYHGENLIGITVISFKRRAESRHKGPG